jgi:flagellar basal-body rod protein FlgC
MSFLKSIHIAAQGMRVQSGRMRVVAENIANADSAPAAPGQQPYRRKVSTIVRPFDEVLEEKGLALGRIREDRSAFRSRFEPGHPAADQSGMVKLPNVDPLIEQMDMREAQRSYEANLGVVGVTRRMIARTLDILRA